MINANRKITIFNLRYDSESRRNTFVPTGISGVSFYDVRKTQDSSGVRDEDWNFKIRIPVDAVIQSGRSYIDADHYAQLTDEEARNYWTLQTGCYIYTGLYESGGDPLTEDQIEQLKAAGTLDGEIITVVEYADNTKRGTKAVQHWRIGAA